VLGLGNFAFAFAWPQVVGDSLTCEHFNGRRNLLFGATLNNPAKL
jgi:hypothetical protein